MPIEDKPLPAIYVDLEEEVQGLRPTQCVLPMHESEYRR